MTILDGEGREVSHIECGESCNVEVSFTAFEAGHRLLARLSCIDCRM